MHRFFCISYLIVALLAGCQIDTTTEAEQPNISPQLLLLSKGLVNDSLQSAFQQFTGPELAKWDIAVIVNASNKPEKRLKKLKKVKSRFHKAGADSSKISLFDIMKRNPAELISYDLIYLLGGNPFLLLEEMQRSGADSILQTLGQQGKALMGYSAGSLVLGPGLELMQAADSLLGYNERGWKNLQGLGLYDFEIFPHYTEFTTEVEGLAALIDAYQQGSKRKLYLLEDDQGILIQGDQLRLIDGDL